MIKTNYGTIPDKLFNNYLERLIDKTYKILCMKEDNNKTLYKHMKGLQRELVGNKQLITVLKCDSDFLSLLAKIEFLIHNDVDLPIWKKDVFDSITLIERMQGKYLKKEE